jgi:hypothetical protein
MAKRKRKSRKPVDSADSEPPLQDTSKSSASKGQDATGLFTSLKEGLRVAGQTAERYARLGISTASLEKMKLELKMAYSRLGENIVKCWDAAPDIGVAANDPAVSDTYRKVRDLRRKIREAEAKIRTLQQAQK